MPLVVYFKLQIGDLAAKRVIKDQAASIFHLLSSGLILRAPQKNKPVKWKSGIFLVRQTFKRPYVFVWFGFFFYVCRLLSMISYFSLRLGVRSVIDQSLLQHSAVLKSR